jgi:hypothetical protein
MVLVVNISAMMMKLLTVTHACIALSEAVTPHHFYLQLKINPALSPIKHLLSLTMSQLLKPLIQANVQRSY